MRFLMLGLILLLLAPSLAFATEMQIPAHETITVVADEWCPYNCGEKDSKQGYMVEIVRAAFKKANIDVIYKVIPWAEAITRTRAGEFDALFGSSHGDAPDFIFPDILQGISLSQFWVNKDSKWVYDGTASLKGLRLGIVQDYSYGKVMDAYLKRPESERKVTLVVATGSDATRKNVDALLSGKLDAILEDRNVIQYYFASRHLPMPFKYAGNAIDMDHIADTFVYIAFGPNKPKAREYSDILSQGLKEMRRNGELKEILSRYSVSETYRYIGSDNDNVSFVADPGR